LIVYSLFAAAEFLVFAVSSKTGGKRRGRHDWLALARTERSQGRCGKGRQKKLYMRSELEELLLYLFMA
jgi:hypothetical protein